MLKRGQATAFIIIALIIVVVGVLIYFFYPEISAVFGGDSEPNTFMRDCIGSEIRENVDLLSRQGGYANPEGFITYEDEKVKYLCYTSQYYVPCYVQQPLVKEHFEEELATLLDDKGKECVDELVNYYERRGYEITQDGEVSTAVEIVPGKIDIVVTAPMTFTGETTQRYRDFRFGEDSEMYFLLMTATSIIDFESTYGDSESLLYIQYYPNLRIEKNKLGDGSTIYKIHDVTSEESFTFASRSLAWPGGLGL